MAGRLTWSRCSGDQRAHRQDACAGLRLHSASAGEQARQVGILLYGIGPGEVVNHYRRDHISNELRGSSFLAHWTPQR